MLTQFELPSIQKDSGILCFFRYAQIGFTTHNETGCVILSFLAGDLSPPNWNKCVVVSGCSYTELEPATNRFPIGLSEVCSDNRTTPGGRPTVRSTAVLGSELGNLSWDLVASAKKEKRVKQHRQRFSGNKWDRTREIQPESLDSKCRIWNARGKGNSYKLILMILMDPTSFHLFSVEVQPQVGMIGADRFSGRNSGACLLQQTLEEGHVQMASLRLGFMEMAGKLLSLPEMNYCWWKKSCTTWDVWNLVNNGINYLSTGAGFLPSTVLLGGFQQKCHFKSWMIFHESDHVSPKL